MMKCPRCDCFAFEKFKTHTCCHACFYEEESSVVNEKSPDNLDVPAWAVKAMREDEKQKEFINELENQQFEKRESA